MQRSDMLEMHIFVSGNVQGVGFRATVKRLAEQLGLTGYTRNLPDGRVEICVQGEKSVLEQLLEQVRKRFENHIHNVDSTLRSITEKYTEFKIVPFA